jgi:hypothetical protein
MTIKYLEHLSCSPVREAIEDLTELRRHDCYTANPEAQPALGTDGRRHVETEALYRTPDHRSSPGRAASGRQCSAANARLGHEANLTVESETISEVNTLGFELYRLEAQGPVLINPELLPARNVDLGGVDRVRETMSRPRGMVRSFRVGFETPGRRLEYGPFEIAVAPSTQVKSVQMVEGGLELRFTGEPNAECLIETTDDLTLGRWTESGSSRSDPEGVIQFQQPVGGLESTRFRRALRR